MFNIIEPVLLTAVVIPLFKYTSPFKVNIPSALKEILFKALLEVPIEFVIVKLLAVEKLTLPKVLAVVRELRVLGELTIKEPPPMKFTISLSPIEKVFLFEESISMVADRAGWV